MKAEEEVQKESVESICRRVSQMTLTIQRCLLKPVHQKHAHASLLLATIIVPYLVDRKQRLRCEIASHYTFVLTLI